MLLKWVDTFCAILLRGHAVAQLVETLLYKPKDREFDSVWCHWHNPSGRIMALGPTHSLTEINTRNISLGQRRPVRRADNLITFMSRLA